MLITFVCTGNICRSPMAEGFARASRPRGPITFASAGTHAVAGTPVSARATSVMGEKSIDISAHVAAGLHEAAGRVSDVVYVMTAAHAAYIRAAYPQLAEKVALLDPDGNDIPDPYGRSLDEYRRARDLIQRAVSRRAAEWTS